MYTQSFLLIVYIYVLGLWGVFFSSKIGAMIILLFAGLVSFIYFQKFYTRTSLTILGGAIALSTTLIIIIKTLYIHDIFLTSYRVSNTVEHLNLMVSLCFIAWYIAGMYFDEKRALLWVTILLSFSASVILEMLQYAYREYYNLVAGKSHGLYNDSMIDLSVNLLGAIVFTILISKLIGFRK